MTLLCLLLCPSAASAAEPAPLLDTIDAEYQLAAGGAGYGVWARGAHTWERSPHVSLRAGPSVGAFTSSDAWANGAVVVQGRVSELRVQLHADVALHSDRFYAELGLYGGAYAYHSRGAWTNTEQQLSQPDSVDQLLPDWGVRLALGATVHKGWGVQLSLTDSLRRIGGDQGLLGGLLTMDADAKLTLGLGLRYALQRRSTPPAASPPAPR